MAKQPLALFISDIHLGTQQCNADALLKFLKDHESTPHVYLVGDIVDIWALKRSPYWPASHNTVVQKLLRMSRKGAIVTYVVGNHDEALKSYLPLKIGDIQVTDQCVFFGPGGKKWLIVHGDEFDGPLRSMGWLYVLGDAAYTVAIKANTLLNLIRQMFGLEYWSLSAFLKKQVKQAVKFVSKFQHLVLEKAKREEADVVVCGHIHSPAITHHGSVMYVNDGDWCESCTGAVLYTDGSVEIVRHDGAVLYKS